MNEVIFDVVTDPHINYSRKNIKCNPEILIIECRPINKICSLLNIKLYLITFLLTSSRKTEGGMKQVNERNKTKNETSTCSHFGLKHNCLYFMLLFGLQLLSYGET